MRYGYRLAIGLLACVTPVGSRLDAADSATVDRLRIELPQSMPTLLRLPAATVGRIKGADKGFTVLGGRKVARRVPGSGPDTTWIVTPDSAQNRRWTIDVSPGSETVEQHGSVSRDGVKVERFLWDEDLVFGAVAGAKPEVYDRALPHFYRAKIGPGGSTSIPVQIPAPGASPDARVSIKVSLAATHEGLVRLSATWGAKEFAPVAAVRSDALSTVSYWCDGRDVPRAGTPFVLTDATTSVPPTTPDDTSDDRGVVWIDSVELRVPLDAPGVARTQVEQDVWIRLVEIDASTVAMAQTDSHDPLEVAKGTDELILTTRATAAGAARLAAHRSANGIKAVAIPFADVVSRFGMGNPHPEVIGHYLHWLAEAGTTPRFLLLAGDAMRDVVDDPATSIPTAYGRTMYNGATASDRLFVRAGLEKGVKPPSVGRLPFRDAATMDAYVDRVIAYETKPPADRTRRLVRFVTSEGRFGPLIDGLLQNLFENIVSEEIPPAYDVEVTFASANSAYCWPPSRFHEKVIGGLNEGALFYTYVGHGWAEGFDSLRVGNSRYPILRSADVPQVNVKGTPPAMFVVACTTATFDDPDQTAVGELLLARPHGPLTYWGATRVCHPAFNSFIGRQIAMTIFKDPNRRIGEVLDAAVKGVLEPDPADKGRKLIEFGARQLTPGTVPLERILEEGAWMYTLLGDPAVKLALPKEDLRLTTFTEVVLEGADVPVVATVKGPFADGTNVEISIEVPRNVRVGRDETKGLSPDDAMRARHASSNDKTLARATVVAVGGTAKATLDVPATWFSRTLSAKAWCISGGDIHQGAAPVTLSK